MDEARKQKRQLDGSDVVLSFSVSGTSQETKVGEHKVLHVLNLKSISSIKHAPPHLGPSSLQGTLWADYGSSTEFPTELYVCGVRAAVD